MKKWMIVICVLALFLAGCSSKKDTGVLATESNPKASTPAASAPAASNPADSTPFSEVPTTRSFTVYNTDGEPVKFADYLGKPIVLNFWASWCGPCKSEMPTFQQAFEEFGDQVQFLMINVGEMVDDAESFLASTGYTFPVLFDINGEGAYAYQISAIPTTFFLNASGEVVDADVGAMPESDLLAAIEAIQ